MKKIILKTAIAISLLIAFSYQSKAQSFNTSADIGIIEVGGQKIILHDLIMGGLGCPQGSVNAYVNESATISFFDFDKFSLGAKYNSSIERQACNLAFSMSIPKGYALSVSSLVNVVVNNQSSENLAQLSYDSFLAGQSGVKKSIMLPAGQYSKRIYLDKNTSVSKNQCGDSEFIFRVNLSALLQKKDMNAVSALKIQNMMLKFKLVPCDH